MPSNIYRDPQQQLLGPNFNTLQRHEVRDYPSEAAIAFPISDEFLIAKVSRSLIATGRYPLQNLRITVQAGYVRLEGSVPSFFAKQLATEAISEISEVHELDNLLSVEVTV